MINEMKHMKKAALYTSLTIFMLLFTLSCGKNFLNEPPRTVTIDDLVNNPQDGAPRLTGAVYNKLYDWDVHTFSWIGISSITSDDADKGSEPGDAGTDKDLLDNWTFGPSGFSFNEEWTGLYDGIGRAAYAIKYIQQMDLPQADKDRYLSEVKLLRAYFYFCLVRTFGGVPKVDHVLESQEDINEASIRASAQEIYAFIEQDCNEAIAKLPSNIDPAENGRVSKWAATALLAKVYLYQKKWAAAKTLCDQIINSGKFALLNDYSQIWREAGEFLSESIWEVNAIAIGPSPKGVQQYSSVQDIRPRGWGFNTPSQDLVNAYEPNDKRKDATIMFRGQTLWDGEVFNTSAPNERYNYKAYASRTMETFSGDQDQSNKNLRLFRYGEILLIKAEVENELNNIPDAKTALNLIRKRAGLANTTATTQAELRDAIYKERRVEMAFEHDRTFDLRRTGRAGAVLRALGKNYVDGRHELFPIPQIQIDRSSGRLIQNPGY
jgi:starch-binding outer membrane protein, SusD/RagB family